MTLALYAHPFSSYSQKALIALYENAIAFEFRMLGPDAPEHAEAWMRLWPLAKFPVLKDGETVIVESSSIIEYLQATCPVVQRLIPDDPRQAVEVRMMDRIFDRYVMTPMQDIVRDALRDSGERIPGAVTAARQQLDTAYAWLDKRLRDTSTEWAAGEDFSLADCAAAPSLFYADWTHPIAEPFDRLRAYRARLLARPSFARAVDEARPYRHLFPLGAPDRD